MKKILTFTLILFTGFQSFAQKKSKGISFSLQVGSEDEIRKPIDCVLPLCNEINKTNINRNSHKETKSKNQIKKSLQFPSSDSRF